MSTDKLLKQGIAVLKAGLKAKARDLLTQVVEQDERNEMAWLWLSGAVETEEECRICLENVLVINSNNSGTQCGLEGLRKKSPDLFSGSRQVETSLWRIGKPKPDPEASSPVLSSGKDTEKELLKQVMAAIKAGDKEEGEHLLVDVLKQDGENETAWLLMSRCMDDQEVKRECLKLVLEINPENDLATKGLKRLETLSKAEKSSGRFNLSRQQKLIAGIAGGVLVFACLVGLGALWAISTGRLPLGAIPPSSNKVPTSTSNTAQGDLTAIALPTSITHLDPNSFSYRCAYPCTDYCRGFAHSR
jgi:hypothetical protein